MCVVLEVVWVSSVWILGVYIPYGIVLPSHCSRGLVRIACINVGCCTPTRQRFRARFAGVVPQPSAAGTAAVEELGPKVGALLQAYVAAMEAKRLREGLKCAIQLSALGNQFFQVGGVFFGVFVLSFSCFCPVLFCFFAQSRCALSCVVVQYVCVRCKANHSQRGRYRPICNNHYLSYIAIPMGRKEKPHIGKRNLEAH